MPFPPHSRYITLVTPDDPAAAMSTATGVGADGGMGGLADDKEEEASGVDLRTLRAIRVLRPLKLVSGVPSEYE